MSTQVLLTLTALLQEVETLSKSNRQNQALEILLEIMNYLCLELEQILVSFETTTLQTLLTRLNQCWFTVISLDSKLLRRLIDIDHSDWGAVKEALESSCNILELYGLVD
jgi:hypothetical protein